MAQSAGDEQVGGKEAQGIIDKLAEDDDIRRVSGRRRNGKLLTRTTD